MLLICATLLLVFGMAVYSSLGYFLLPLTMILTGRIVYGEHLYHLQKIATALAVIGVANELYRTGGFSWTTLVVATEGVRGGFKLARPADEISILDIVNAIDGQKLIFDWPKDKLRIHLLDDGRRADFKAFAQDAGIHYITRADNRHAKAGNLNHALTLIKGELVAIFDCDHIPARSFLQVTTGWFLRDPKLALVQTPHHFLSPDPLERCRCWDLNANWPSAMTCWS